MMCVGEEKMGKSQREGGRELLNWNEIRLWLVLIAMVPLCRSFPSPLEHGSIRRKR